MRRQLTQTRRAMGDEQRARASAVICERVKAMDDYRRATCIAAFAPMPEEVNLWPLLEHAWRAGKSVALPKIISFSRRLMRFYRVGGKQELRRGAKNILQPRAAESAAVDAFDFVLVPALGVDTRLYRLGYGGGFYDGFLSLLQNTPACAAVFACQCVARVPTEEHDIQLQKMVSEQ